MDPKVEKAAERALRAIQKYDEVAPWLQDVGTGPRVRRKSFRYLLIEAETALGEILGLECTGEPGGWDENGTVVVFDHNGGTCPVHEWFDENDQPEIIRKAGGDASA